MRPVEVKSTKALCKALGLPASAAPRVELRRNLVIGIRRAIERRGLTHAQAAKRTGLGRTVITAIVNGNLRSISTDRLLDAAAGLGLKVSLKVA